jgi:hypothetical protein|tara:strand:- start:79 stop:252 length:174 start_codon:yes stop_codon:yes gene_type:complete
MNKISEFFKTFYGLFLFTVKSLWIILTTNMKKEAQTYKQEQEEQKRVAKRARIKERK